MHIGVALPTKLSGANPEAILAAALTAERLGWHSVWGDDHVLVDREDAQGARSSASYRTIFEILTTLAWVGGQTSRVLLGTGVLVVPQRNAVVLAKELATVDALTRGRLVVGVGLGWNEPEYRNLGAADRFHVRGAFLDEAIRLWRHLWSGTEGPFEGRFHTIQNALLSPPPAQGGALPIIVGGRSDHGVRRASRLGDGYVLSQNGPEGLAARLPLLRAAAAEAGRPAPRTLARAPLFFETPPPGATPATLHGSPDDMQRTIVAWEGVGLDELILDIDEVDAERVVETMERFDREVLAGAAEQARP
jgi:probable F420-dependent oxidoreductase